MADPTTAWLNALAFLAGYGLCELQHRIRKHLRSMGPPSGSYGLPPDHDWRRSFNHENTNPPQGPPPMKLRRSEPDPPERFIRIDEGPIARNTARPGPITPKPAIIPKGQRHPCYGANPRAMGVDTVFAPWVHDGRVVHWGLPLLTRGEALAEARRMAEVIEPRQ